MAAVDVTTPAKARYDLVVFGATGFTGQYVVEELLRASQKTPVTWAVAGRNESKLDDVLRVAFQQTGEPATEVQKIIVDVSDENSLNEMCKQTKVLLNCVGPYRFFGEPVVKACIANQTDHLDISGEPLFLEKIQLDYHELAKEKGVYVIGSTGFDSIPCETCIQLVRRHFPGDISYVETYAKFKHGPEGMKINAGTWYSAVQAVGDYSKLKPVRQELMPERMPFGNVHAPRRWLFYSEDASGWCLPFLGSDKAVAVRTQYHLYTEKKERPFHIRPYVRASSLMNAIFLLIAIVLMAITASFKFGRKLLNKYPDYLSFGVISTTGATRKQIKDSSFSMTAIGYGHGSRLAEPSDIHAEPPDTKLKVHLSAPEGGYLTTSICMVQSGIVLLKEREKMPDRGGVYTPGSAFVDTTLIDRLRSNGIECTVGEPEKIEK